MDLRVKRNMLLPVWLLIWLTATIVLVDLAFLRAAPDTGVVTSAQIRSASKGGKVCELAMQLPFGVVSRSTDPDTCHQVSVGQTVIVEKTRILDRWLALYDSKNTSLTGAFLENRVMTDVAFILLAIFLPLLFSIELSDRVKRGLSIIFAFEAFGMLYFWALFVQ